MRSDMHKVIVERPRRGHAERFRPRRQREKALHLVHDDEGVESNASKRCSMKPDRRDDWDDRKELNENLAPLRRWLAKQIGRPWAKVYSEIVQTIGKGNAIRLHVFQHVEDYVEEDYFMVDGVPHTFPYGTPLAGFWRGDDALYVDKNGILRKATRSKLIKKGSQITFIDRGPAYPIGFPGYEDYRSALVKIDGIWYSMTTLPNKNPYRSWSDRVMPEVPDWPQDRVPGDGPKYQLNKKLLRKYGLTNTSQ